MSALLLPGIPLTVLLMVAIMKLWRPLGSKTRTSVASVFFKVNVIFSVVVYVGIIAFIALMWDTLGGWSVVIGVQTYVILALYGFIFTGKFC